MSSLSQKIIHAVKSTQYDQIQNLVRDATSNDVVGALPELYTKITHFADDPLTYHSVFEMLWKRLTDVDHHKHVLKSLHLLYHLLTHLPGGHAANARKHSSGGRARLEADVVKRISVIVQLTKYSTDRGSFRGGDVRDAARQIYDYLFPKALPADAKANGKADAKAAAAAKPKAKEPAAGAPAAVGLSKKPSGNGKAATAPAPVAPEPDMEVDPFDVPAPIPAKAGTATTTKPRSRRGSGADAFDAAAATAAAAAKPAAAGSKPVSRRNSLDAKHSHGVTQQMLPPPHPPTGADRYGLTAQMFAPAPTPVEQPKPAQPQQEVDLLDMFFNPQAVTHSVRTPSKQRGAAEPGLMPINAASPPPAALASAPASPAKLQSPLAAAAAAAGLSPGPAGGSASPSPSPSPLLSSSLAVVVGEPTNISPAASPGPVPPAGSGGSSPHNEAVNKFLSSLLTVEPAGANGAPPMGRRVSKKVDAYRAAQQQREIDAKQADAALAARLAAQQAAIDAQKRANPQPVPSGLRSPSRSSFRRHSLPPGATGVPAISQAMQNELAVYARYINAVFNAHNKQQPAGAPLLPLIPNGWQGVLETVRDGVMPSHMLNQIERDTVDMRALNAIPPLPFAGAPQTPADTQALTAHVTACTDNCHLVLNAGRGIGLRWPAQVVTAKALSAPLGSEQQPPAATELAWALVKAHALKSVSVQTHPHLAPLLATTPDEAFQMPADRVLLRWFQAHVDAAQAAQAAQEGAPHKPHKTVTNLKDSESYLDLLHRLIALKRVPVPPLPPQLALPKDGKSAPSHGLLLARAEHVLDLATRCLGVENRSVTAHDIASGHPRANLLFTALLFDRAAQLGLDRDWFNEQKAKEEKEAAAAAAAAAAADEAERLAAAERERAAAAAAAAAAEAAARAERERLAREAEEARQREAARLAAEAARRKAEEEDAERRRQKAMAEAEAAERARQLELLERERAAAAAKAAAEAAAAAERQRLLDEENARKIKAAADAAAAAAVAKANADAAAAAAKAQAAAEAKAKAEAKAAPAVGLADPTAIAAAAAKLAVAKQQKTAVLLRAQAAATSSAPVKVALKTPTERNEERCLRMWINSVLSSAPLAPEGSDGTVLAPQPADDVYVEDLFDDLRDGLVLLKLQQRLWSDSAAAGANPDAEASPQLVNWKKVETKFNVQTRLKCVSNCNYALELAKTRLKLPGLTLAGSHSGEAANVSGVDVADGAVKPILSVGWQLMRYALRTMLSRLVRRSSADNVRGVPGAERDADFDALLLSWGNKRVAAWVATHQSQAAAVGVLDAPVTSFADKRLSDGVFVIQLAAAVAAADGRAEHDVIASAATASPDVLSPSAGFVSWKEVVPIAQCAAQAKPDSALRNCSYALALCRKLNATIFLLPEDIVERRAKLILTLFASLMTVDLSLTTRRHAKLANAEPLPDSSAAAAAGAGAGAGF